jgi:hypothetical protein
MTDWSAKRSPISTDCHRRNAHDVTNAFRGGMASEGSTTRASPGIGSRWRYAFGVSLDCYVWGRSQAHGR